MREIANLNYDRRTEEAAQRNIDEKRNGLFVKHVQGSEGSAFPRKAEKVNSKTLVTSNQRISAVSVSYQQLPHMYFSQ
jgi:hypothetical protein